VDEFASVVLAVQYDGLVVALSQHPVKKISLESSIFKWLESFFCRLGLMLNCLVSQPFVVSSATQVPFKIA
jgi:hypothetical protein